MRLTCGSHVVVCVWWHLQLLFAARGPPKTSSEPRRGRGIVFRNSRISLSAGRRACEPAAKPAIPGVILLHNGFVWPERTPGWPWAPQGISPQFPGVLVGPPHVRKCHQMSSKEHIQLGWVVRWVLSTPPGHPAARRCVRVVPVLPLLLCTRPARARPSVGGQSPTPAPRQLPWSPPRGWCSRRLPPSTFEQLAHKDSCL